MIDRRIDSYGSAKNECDEALKILIWSPHHRWGSITLSHPNAYEPSEIVHQRINFCIILPVL